jgi:hypothetical protein
MAKLEVVELEIVAIRSGQHTLWRENGPFVVAAELM